MATIRLTRKEADYGPLPHVCMKCGEPTDEWVKKELTYYPKWVWLGILGGLLPLIILMVVFTKRTRLNAPMCPKHRWHWTGANAIALLGLLAVIGGIVVMISVAESRPRPSETTMTAVVIGFFVLLLAWLGTCIFLSVTRIRPVKMDDYDVTLAGVSDVFADELDKMLEKEGYDEEYDIRSKKRGRDRGRDLDDRRERRLADEDGDRPRRLGHSDDDRIQR